MYRVTLFLHRKSEPIKCLELFFLQLSVESLVLGTPDPFYYMSFPPYTPINLLPKVIAFWAKGLLFFISYQTNERNKEEKIARAYLIGYN